MTSREIRVAEFMFVGRHAARPSETVMQVTTADGNLLMLSFPKGDAEALARALFRHLGTINAQSSSLN